MSKKSHAFNNDKFRALFRECLGDMVMNRASHAALAKYVIEAIGLSLKRMGRDSAQMTMGPGHFYIYDDQYGVWRTITSFHIRVWCQYLDGLEASGKAISISRNMMEGVAYCISHYPALSEEFGLPGPRSGLTFRNGFVVVNEDGIDLEEHSPENYAQHYIDDDYEEDGNCPEWLKFLDSLFADDEDGYLKIQMIQEFIGAALIGKATTFARCMVLVGGGANGKSMFIDAMSRLFPEEGRIVSSPDKWEDDIVRCDLHGAMLNTVHELPTTRVMQTDYFKTIICGDHVQARGLYKDPIAFTPVAAHVMSTNGLPTVKDYSDGFWRRFLLVDFNQNFLKNGRRQTQEEIFKRIEPEKTAIITWALEGARRLCDRGEYTLTPSHNRLLDEWQNDADGVRGFVKACCVSNEDSWTKASVLYEDYKDWSEKAGRRPVSRANMGNRLASLGVAKKRKAGGIGYNLQIRERINWKEYN